MNSWPSKIILLGFAALTAFPAAAAPDMTSGRVTFPSSHARGILDLDIYSPNYIPSRLPDDAAGLPMHGWVPGDARAERGEPTWVKHLSHVGYASLGIAGLVVSVASGGIAPAVGFGLVALVHSWLEWRQITSKDRAVG